MKVCSEKVVWVFLPPVSSMDLFSSSNTSEVLSSLKKNGHSTFQGSSPGLSAHIGRGLAVAENFNN